MSLNMGGLEQALTDMESKTPGTIDKFVSMAGEQLLDVVRDNTRTNKKTGGGTLRLGWKRTRTVDGMTEVYNNVDYVLHIEYGHRIMGGPKHTKVVGFWKGDHMLRNSVEILAENFQEIAEAAMKELTDG